MSAVDAEFERLLEFVRDARGFDYTGYRRPTLIRRFGKRLEAVKVETWADYRTYLESHPEEFSELFNTILINVTAFFRDKETWEVVASDVIPALLESRAAGRADSRLVCRVRVRGGAVHDRDAPCGSARRRRVQAARQDLRDGRRRRRARAGARRRLHGEAACRRPRGAAGAVLPAGERRIRVQERPAPQRHLRAERPAQGSSDLARRPPRLAQHAHVLRPGDPGPDPLQLLLRAESRRLSRRREGRGAPEGAPQFFAAHDLKRRIFVKDGAEDSAFHVPRPALLPPRELDDTGADAAFEHGPVAQLVVDHDNCVAALNQAARTLFSLKLKDVGRPLQDLEVSYRPVDLRSLVDEARDKGRTTGVKDVEWEAPKGTRRTFDVHVAPLAAVAEQLAGVSIAFVDTTVHRVLESQLEHARRELESAYEELQSTVEELETTNEELQSTNEELETTNEELQSTNEELETMNEELQSTNEELETMNDELRDRTDETLRSNAFLTSVLASVQQAVVVVDRELRIVAWSSHATELLGLRDDEVEGEHLLNLDVGLPVATLREPVRRVLAGARGRPSPPRGTTGAGSR